MSCPVCGNENLTEMHPSQIGDSDKVQFSYTFSPVHSKTFRTVSCRDCTHVFCSPIPENIGKYYVDVVDDEYLRHEDSRKLAAREVIRALRRVDGAGSKRLLDIGCATGDFLDCAREGGYAAEGLEVSEWSANIARNRGFQVYGEFLDTFVASHKGRLRRRNPLGRHRAFRPASGRVTAHTAAAETERDSRSMDRGRKFHYQPRAGAQMVVLARPAHSVFYRRQSESPRENDGLRACADRPLSLCGDSKNALQFAPSISRPAPAPDGGSDSAVLAQARRLPATYRERCFSWPARPMIACVRDEVSRSKVRFENLEVRFPMINTAPPLTPYFATSGTGTMVSARPPICTV